MRYSRSPLPFKGNSQSRSMRRSPSRSRSPHPRRSWSRSPSHSRDDAANPGNTLYITGLSSAVSERDLEDHLAREGKVCKCRLIVEPYTRTSRGFAFVTMETNEDADRCIKYLNQSFLNGRHITVEKSRRKRPRTPTPGQYVGLKNFRASSYRHDRGRLHGGYDLDYYDDGYRQPAMRSYYRDARDYSPHRLSPYSERSRRN